MSDLRLFGAAIVIAMTALSIYQQRSYRRDLAALAAKTNKPPRTRPG